MTRDDAPERSRRGWSTPGARLAYLRLASAVGLAPLRIPIPLILLTGAAWAVMLDHAMLHHAINMSEPMGSAGSVLDDIAMFGNKASLSGLGAFVAVWTVMMIAMMLPGTAPMILTFAAAQARRDRNNVVVPTWMFIAGYILVWSYAGLVVYFLLHAGKDLADYLGWLESGAWAPLVLGITLTLAGLYQFTPLKNRGLHYCRWPSLLLRRHRRKDWESAGLGDGDVARRLLSKLLLGTVRRDGCGWWDDERRLDACDDTRGIRRKGVAVWSGHLGRGGRWVDRFRAAGWNWRRSPLIRLPGCRRSPRASASLPALPAHGKLGACGPSRPAARLPHPPDRSAPIRYPAGALWPARDRMHFRQWSRGK